MTDDDVKLPEPIGYLYRDSISDALSAAHPWLHSTMLVLAADRRPTCRNETPLYDEPTVRRLIAEAVPNAVAAELERVANEPPVNGNDLSRARVLMAAAAIRNRSKA